MRFTFIARCFKPGGKAIVGVAISALKPAAGEDCGNLDQLVYAALLNDCIGAAILEEGGCAAVIIDDGRYHALALDHIRSDIAFMIGSCGEAKLELEQLAINLHHPSLRAKRGNPYYGAANGLPRFARKDEVDQLNVILLSC